MCVCVCVCVCVGVCVCVCVCVRERERERERERGRGERGRTPMSISKPTVASDVSRWERQAYKTFLSYSAIITKMWQLYLGRTEAGLLRIFQTVAGLAAMLQSFHGV